MAIGAKSESAPEAAGEKAGALADVDGIILEVIR